MKVLAITLCALLVAAAPCLAQTFTLDAVNNCPGLGYSVNFGLTGPYTYHIQYVSGAWSPVPDDSYYGGFTWSGRVSYYDYATAQYGALGAPNTLYQTPAEAEAAAQGIYAINHPMGGTVTFYLEEIGMSHDVCNDNRGSVTLKFVFPVATKPTTWGKIKALYR